ncbi:PVC-type heme-binding CxxCH protein [Parapedobacter sp. DT-150]|uniref:PVC-type heme-binding CxxCH protein n=1 Tax=Parapedobacter sp. DT-150 TaxID=3396162 RepID=UPI003F1A1F91
MKITFRQYVEFLGMSVMCLGACTGTRYEGALPPDEALDAFALKSGFEMEVFAAEPQVMDPIDLVFDEEGRMYVVEMGDYPYKPEPGKGRGKIKVLKDADGDGRIDETTVFAEGLPDVTSVLPWGGGLIVTSAPDILFLKDTTGDDVADSREVLFTGFFENNSEAQITNLRYGVDNWIYANNNGQRGEVTFTRRPDLPALSVAGGDFRFRLDKNLVEVESGAGQFGLALDDWGNRFFTQNTLHIQTAPMPWRYLKRHEHLPSYAATANIYAHDLRVFQASEPPYWRVERSKQRQEQYDASGLDRVEYIEGHFTGASGGTMYNANLFPDAFYGNVFTGEVSCNLVHRDVVESTGKGPFFTAHRHESELESEFLTSTDPWFRPVNFCVGPEGALYVVDMYRQHIETPVSIPEELKTDMDFEQGNQYGRIYRIFPEGHRPKDYGNPKLGEKTAAELVAVLSHADHWWRIQAQRLLIERQDKSTVPAIEQLFRTHQDPRTRLHAFYVLEGLDALSASVVKQALNDEEANVRRHAVMVAERFPECRDELLKRVDDPVAHTAFQAVLSAGQFADDRSVAALAHAAVNHADDGWFRKAVLSAEPGSSAELLAQLTKAGFFEQEDDGRVRFIEDFGYVSGSSGQVSDILAATDRFKDESMTARYRVAFLSGLSTGLQKTEMEAKDKGLLKKTLETGKAAFKDDESRKVMDSISTILD